MNDTKTLSGIKLVKESPMTYEIFGCLRFEIEKANINAVDLNMHEMKFEGRFVTPGWEHVTVEGDFIENDPEYGLTYLHVMSKPGRNATFFPDSPYECPDIDSLKEALDIE